jgi:hypothetical protein
VNDSILFNRGDQPVRFVPVDRLGHARRIDPATFSIVDLRVPEGVDDHEVVASTGATVSAVTSTTVGAAGPGTADPRRFTVADATGFRTGGVYLLQDSATGREESVRVSVVRGLELTATSPLMRAYATGATITALELEGTFPAAVADDQFRLERGGGPFQITWVYSLDGQLYVAPRELWITRYGVQPWVTAAEVFRHLPGLAQSVGDAVAVEDAIAAATDDLVGQLLSTTSRRRDPANFRGNLSADLAVRNWAIMYLLRGTRSDDALALAEKYESKGLMHSQNLTEGKPPGRTVSVNPTNETATAGGEVLASSWLGRS